MPRISVTASNAPTPAGPYSHGVVAGGLLFSAGFGPQIPPTTDVPEGVAEQTRQVMRNIEAVLHEAGGSLDDVVKATVYLQHLERDFAEYNQAYGEFFSEPYPVRTTVGANLNNILVEIDIVAKLPE